MKITILNGNPVDASETLEKYLNQLKIRLESQNHEVNLLSIRELDAKYCIGCFGCWVKTPGKCSSADESSIVCRSVVISDFTLWVAPLKMGFPSAMLKKVMDKSISIIHPYFSVVRGEAHHRKRYKKYPRIGLLIEKESDTDQQDIEIVTDIFNRTALNMKSRLEFSLTTDDPVEEVAQRISKRSKDILPYAKRLQPTEGERISPPKRLTLFNGSPRGKKGNTPIMLTQFMKGFISNPGNNAEIHHINRLKQTDDFVQAFADAECVWLGFPLYTDAMPASVKHFIEALEPLKDRTTNPPMGFVIQSGFPESLHSRYVERYLKKLAARMKAPYLGTIVKGGGEGIRIMPEESTRGLFENLQALGREFGEKGQLKNSILQSIAKPERYHPLLIPIFKIFVHLPVSSWYWDSQLKEYGVYEERFATPYQV
jgi:multimeric flavodoxin WrbA